MTKNKVFLSILVSVGVFFMLYGYQDLIMTEEINMVDQALINGFVSSSNVSNFSKSDTENFVRIYSFVKILGSIFSLR